jgi:hypothetical protein
MLQAMTDVRATDPVTATITPSRTSAGTRLDQPDAGGRPEPGRPDTGPPGTTTPAGTTTGTATAPLAVSIGWTMALLFGALPQRDVPPDRLPTEHELPPARRVELEVKRVNALLASLGEALSPGQPLPVQDVGEIGGTVDPTGRTWQPDEDSRQRLRKTNVDILTWLAREDRDLGLAYQLGRSLRDTANPPLRFAAGTDEAAAVPDALRYQLSRARVAKLQEWLATLADRLPADSAAIVGASIGRWSDLVATVLVPGAPGKLTPRSPSASEVAARMRESLLPQGDTWLNLLVGVESSAGLLTPEGYVAAGEAALSRTARIIRQILLHYWFALLVLAAALAVVLFFCVSDLAGAARVWTQIAAIAGALGVTAKGVGSTMTKLSKDAEKPIFGAEKIDAIAWAVTSVPPGLKLDRQGVQVLRSSGIRPPSPMGRV